MRGTLCAHVQLRNGQFNSLLTFSSCHAAPSRDMGTVEGAGGGGVTVVEGDIRPYGCWHPR